MTETTSLPRRILSDLIELGGISARFATRSGILSELRPAVVRRLAREMLRGLRGPLVLLRLHAFADPARPALVCEDLRLSYGELDQRACRLAHAFQALGLGAGDRVGLLVDNGHEFIETTAALGHLDMTTVQIGYRLKEKEIAHILAHSGARAVVLHDRYREVLAGARRLAGGPPDSMCVVIGEPAGSERCYEEMATRGSERDPPYAMGGGYGALMLYTSGTTGKSKGARRDLKETSFAPVLAMLAELPLYRDDRHLVCCPLYHAAAPAFCGFVFAVGGCVVIPRRFVAEEVPALIERERITSSVMVPTMLGRLLALPEEMLRRDLGSLRWIMSVAAPLPTEVARRFEERFGPVLYNMYGATETGIVTLARPGEHTARPGTIGRRIFGNEIRLLDAQGREVGVGEVGEMYVKSGVMVSGYDKDEAATRAALRQGYFSVGDLACRDRDGYYYLADRKSDMVISAGVNIYPLEIEQRLHEHPAVADCAVVGRPDPEWGESLVAFIVPAAGREGSPALAEELRAFVAADLAAYKRPRVVEFVESIPRNPTGKIMKRELRERAMQAGTDMKIDHET